MMSGYFYSIDTILHDAEPVWGSFSSLVPNWKYNLLLVIAANTADEENQ